MSKFGEPWDNTLGYIRDNKNKTLLRNHWVDEHELSDVEEEPSEHWESALYHTQQSRIVACVNALAGVENPEAVKELLDTVRLWHSLPEDDKAVPIVQLAVIIAGSEIQFTEDKP